MPALTQTFYTGSVLLRLLALQLHRASIYAFTQPH